MPVVISKFKWMRLRWIGSGDCPSGHCKLELCNSMGYKEFFARILGKTKRHIDELPGYIHIGQAYYTPRTLVEVIDDFQALKKKLTPVDRDSKLLIVFLDAILRFAVVSRGNESRDSQRTRSCLNSMLPFLNRVSLFELGCFLFYCVDGWLSSNRPSQREQIGMQLLIGFVSFCTDILRVDRVSELVPSRLDGYAQLIKGKADPEQFEFEVIQLIVLSTVDGAPSPYTIGHEPVIIFDAISRFHLRAHFVGWCSGNIPVVTGFLEEST